MGFKDALAGTYTCNGRRYERPEDIPTDSPPPQDTNDPPQEDDS